MIDVERRIFYFNTALVGSWTQKTSWLGYHIDSCFSQLIQKFELMKRDGQYISTKCNALSSVDRKDMNNEKEERWLCDSKVGGEVQGLSENRRQLGRINIFLFFLQENAHDVTSCCDGEYGGNGKERDMKCYLMSSHNLGIYLKVYITCICRKVEGQHLRGEDKRWPQLMLLDSSIFLLCP